MKKITQLSLLVNDFTMIFLTSRQANVCLSVAVGMACAMPVAAQHYDKTQQVQEIVVVGNNPQTDNLLLPQVGVKTFSAEDFLKVPAMFGEPDVLRTIQQQAGVSGGIEGFSGIFVRGGENDQNLYVLHHLPLYNVSHLGGLFSTFNVAATDHTKFYKAGFPAQYGGRLSSVTDIKLRESDFEEYHGEASVGLLSGNAYVTGPIVEDYLAFSVGIRRSWSELITIPALAIINHNKKSEGRKEIFGYSFMDVNLKLDYRFADELTGYTHFYYGTDGVKKGEEKFSLSGEDPYNEENLLKLNWGNTGAATGLAWRPNDIVNIAANGYYSHFGSKLSLTNDEQAGDEESHSMKTNKNGIDDIGATIETDLSFGHALVMKLGGDYIHHQYRPEEVMMEGGLSGNGYLPPEAPVEVIANEIAAWSDNTLTIGDWVGASLGVRWNSWSSGDVRHVSLEPRASLRLSVPDVVSIKGSYTRTHQYVQQVSNSYINMPTDAWLPIGTKFAPLECDQVSAGIYGNLAEGCYFSAEGYYKWMRNLLEYKDGMAGMSSRTPWDEKLTSGKGWAYGVDFSLNKETGPLTGSISYGLMWNYRQFDELNGGERFPAKYDNRHKLNISCRYQLSDEVALDLAWTYMTGNRVTVALNNYQNVGSTTVEYEEHVPNDFTIDIAPMMDGGKPWGIGYYSQLNNVRLPAYHRLDIGVSITTEYDNDMTGIWSFGLYNAYCRMNPVGIKKYGILAMPDDEWYTKFQTLGLLPVVPSISYTLKF